MAGSPRCWRNFALNKPSHARARATTMRWPRARTPALCASTWLQPHPPKVCYAHQRVLHETFNPWLNHHRPCLFATEVISDKGKIKKAIGTMT